MLNPGAITPDLPATPQFYFISGVYSLSSWRVPYLSTTLSFQEAAEYLHVASELPGSEDINWKLSELYQRDIDWPRVERQIVPYLNSPDRPQFFNAITVALMPYDRERTRLLDFFNGDGQWNPPPLKGEFAKAIEIGPLSVGFSGDWKSIEEPAARMGAIRWNPHEVFAVALDGQHRLASLKTLSAENNVPNPKHEMSRLPVIMLLFDEALGYEPPERRPIVEVLRTVFIDLNKHARTVSRARQILLDDRDPLSICVRRLVGEEMKSGLGDLEAHPPRLPLSLVDWHSEQAKFDDGPYLTTVLGLDWIVGQIINTKPVGDRTNYAAIRRELRNVETTLGVDLGNARDRLEQLEELITPFVYRDEELESIEKAFAARWSAPVAHLLTKFSPYQELILHRQNSGSLSTEFLSWYRAFEAKEQDQFEGRATRDYRQLLGRLSKRDKPLSEKHLVDTLRLCREVKGDLLAFNVVFQRAFVAAYLEFQRIKDHHIDDLSEGAGVLEPDLDDDDGNTPDELPETTSTPHAMKRAEDFVGIMNRIVESYDSFLDVHGRFEIDDSEQSFWQGTLRKAEGSIDFTQGASGRAKDVIFLCAAMVLYDDTTDPQEESDFDAFWDEIAHNESENALCRRVHRALKRLTDAESSAGGRILSSKDLDFDKDQSRDEIYYRLRWLWEVMGL